MFREIVAGSNCESWRVVARGAEECPLDKISSVLSLLDGSRLFDEIVITEALKIYVPREKYGRPNPPNRLTRLIALKELLGYVKVTEK